MCVRKLERETVAARGDVDAEKLCDYGCMLYSQSFSLSISNDTWVSGRTGTFASGHLNAWGENML